jgi:uncharacterized DUF497 family protein
MPPQQVVWDPEKARRNETKHGIDFDEAATVFRDEERWIALGKSIRQILLVVVHTEDEWTIRIISARKAEPRERRQYEREF